MTRPLVASLALIALLGACSGSGQSKWYNPVSWFGGSKETKAQMAQAQASVGTPEDPRPLVDQVLSMSVERFSGGAIVTATGLPPTQGYWAGELIEEPIVDGRLNYRFVLIPPPTQQAVSTQASREVTVATSISSIKLEQVREITVTGARNARSSRR
ncbi:MAG: hypothetical protein DI533_00910 [Cereibacter sphaeroides]|uniref:Lipoprotein n=1 Tax=Cereibacter sphaeroides TaxID=1063 RepID=A0A2W5SNG1_CERSP|nr:MAG: hypothetical protein DI533_00910 [Cereibacter sphaeroides]